MEINYLNGFGVLCGPSTDHRMLPEAELWTAVMVQAIDDLDRRTLSSSISAQHSAREWFASESDVVGSFVWACHVINVDPDFIRSRLVKKQRIKNLEKVTVAQETRASRKAAA
jgi:hypothetical protein